MGTEDSPYHKALMAVPVSLRGMPRSPRVIVYTLAFIAIFYSIPWLNLGSRDGIIPPLFQRRPRYDVLQYVDPLIGTANGGHVFPGATLPYGMAKPVADTQSPGENAAGYVSDTNPILGFSHLHDSGTGGNPSLGNFPLFVHPGCANDDYRACRFAVNNRPVYRIPDQVFASPGYFAINLTNTVRAEMTASQHVALYRFGFSGKEKVDTLEGRGIPYSPLVLVDLVDLMNSRSAGGVQVYPESGRIVGDGQYSPSFGTGRYQAFFCADFKGARIRRSGTFIGDDAREEPKFFGGHEPGWNNPSGSAGAWVQFERPEGDELLVRVGVSFISVDQACENAEREIGDWDFERVEGEARTAWRKKLGAIEIDPRGVSDELQVTFWSGLYRSMLSPQNYTGENQLWNSTEPYYDSFYCIWDSFRAQHPLLTIIDPVAQTEMIRALVDIFRHEGKLPDCRMSFSKGFTQGGSNADIVIADAWVKNLTANIDWETAYEAVVSDAEIEPPEWGIQGRGSLVSWHKLGYIPWDDKDVNGTGPMSRSVSRGVEYAYDDFCIAQLAEGLNRPADAHKYRLRGANWQNFWNPDQLDLPSPEKTQYRNPNDPSSYSDLVPLTGFKGFLQPRLRNGTFRHQPVRTCSPVSDFHSCYFDTVYDTYEGSPWLYSFFAPQDMATLIRLMGGRDTFVSRLAYFHESGIAYMGNEQAFLPTFQFHYAGRPGMSSYYVRKYIPSLFNASVNGIPGNDDCAMGAFTAFAMMGFFPVAGQDVYLLTPPFFREVRIKAWEEGKWAVIRVRNFDERGRRIYVREAWLNGRKYTRNWITHGFFRKGGVLEFVVGEEEGDWGTREEDVPPSYPVKEWVPSRGMSPEELAAELAG